MKTLSILSTCLLLVGAALTISGTAQAQTAANPPHIMVLFDTSGSMLQDIPGDLTGGDGSWSTTSHGDTCCPGPDDDGDGMPDGYESRMFIAKEVLNEVIWSTGVGEISFGLARYYQTEYPGWTHCNENNLATYLGHGDNVCSTWIGGYREDRISYSGASCYYSSNNTGQVLIPYSSTDANRDELLSWIDHHEVSTSSGGGSFSNPELRGIDGTPLAGATSALETYFDNLFTTGVTPCQSYAIIMSDGDQSSNCGGSAEDAAEDLADLGVTVYTIAFALDASSNGFETLNDMAVAGGTGYARAANSREELRAAFGEIIEEAIQVEVCDGLDNDCDGDIDENLFRPCTGDCGEGQETCIDGTNSDPDLRWGNCTAPDSETETCNGIDDDCDGIIDDGVTQGCFNACGDIGDQTCIDGGNPVEADRWSPCNAPALPPDLCGGGDEDCDGVTDEDETQIGVACRTALGVCTDGEWACDPATGLYCDGTGPTDEICDGLDNDCDGLTDEGLSRACNNDTCTGTEYCTNGTAAAFEDRWGNCTAPAPRDEICNGADDDCNGTVDDIEPLDCDTDCGEGTRTCSSGTWQACTAPPVVAEVCDGLDNDCDGSTDENLYDPCSYDSCSGWAECDPINSAPGAPVWINCSAVSTGEICNGEDDDCDGVIDNGVSQDCTSACGAGTQVCTNGLWGDCSADQPTEEVCDGADNDCDTLTDEGLTRACQPTGAAAGACIGVQSCSNGSATNPDDRWGACSTTVGAEICNNVDDDCDGTVDEITRTCSSICETDGGTQTCTAGSWDTCTARQPTTETCNGIDDDCDGDTDEGVIQDCVYGAGACAGYQLCADGSLPEGNPARWGECIGSISAEVCDGVDNDCDGTTDLAADGSVLERSCSTVCGAGRQQCELGGWGACSAEEPGVEVCDGVDNDCNGLIDDGVTRACLPEESLCEDGIQVCTNNVWGPCSARQPTTEICNGVDDDCNGAVDESDPNLGQVCGTDMPPCTEGVYVCNPGDATTDPFLECAGSVGPTDEICDGIDNDCDGTIDNGLPLGEQCDEGTGLGDEGQCEWGRYQCFEAELVCYGFVGPTDEVCDCIDNDCDAFTDEGLDSPPCGTDVGECEIGYIACVDCTSQCVNGVGARDEVCDGRDNDCDGLTDEEGGNALCPEDEARCIEGQCALPCGEGEFPCPAGRYCQEGDEGRFCISDPCAELTEPCPECQFCDPNVGGCVDLCAGRECGEGMACQCGRCVPATCYYLGCDDEGQLCIDGECVDDPCGSTTCGENQFCRDGECFGLCTPDIRCPDGQSCRDGECVDDPCASTTCGAGQRCDPATGDCTTNCSGVYCSPGQECDPASGACVDDPCTVVTCPDGAECREGTCVVSDGGDGGHTDADGGLYVLATGAGGCVCSAAATTPQAGRGGMALAMLSLIGVALLRRRS